MTVLNCHAGVKGVFVIMLDMWGRQYGLASYQSELWNLPWSYLKLQFLLKPHPINAVEGNNRWFFW